MLVKSSKSGYPWEQKVEAVERQQCGLFPGPEEPKMVRVKEWLQSDGESMLS